MAHDTHSLHVSHYKGSANWRSAVSPADGSWQLFIDAGGSPHLYLAEQVQTNEGETVTTYVATVCAMLRADAEADPALGEGVAAL